MNQTYIDELNHLHKCINSNKETKCNLVNGILTLNTTRGDRLFVSLLSAAFIHLAWLGLTDLNLWIATFISSMFAILVFKFV